MSIGHRLAHEARSILVVTAYFGACFVVIMLLKQLWLADYGIRFDGLATALLGALVTAKVVVLLDALPFQRRLRRLPGIAEVALRTLAYTAAVLVVLLLERAFESRAEAGGFAAALARILDHSDLPRIWATAIAVGLSFLAFTSFALIARTFGAKETARVFLSTRPAAR